MAKETKDAPIVDVGDALSKTELYIEKNKKKLSIITLVVVAVVGGFLAYKFWYVAGEDEAASAAIFKAEQYFEQDSINKAIDGDAVYAGFSSVVEDYGITPTGNLAEYYLGVSLLKKGQYEEAIEHLKSFSSNDQMVSSVALGLIGDANIELGNYDEAVNYYIKAAENNPNEFASPVYLKKAGFAYELKQNYADAVKIYERIKNEYSKTSEAREMEKYIARAKVLGNIM